MHKFLLFIHNRINITTRIVIAVKQRSASPNPHMNVEDSWQLPRHSYKTLKHALPLVLKDRKWFTSDRYKKAVLAIPFCIHTWNMLVSYGRSLHSQMLWVLDRSFDINVFWNYFGCLGLRRNVHALWRPAIITKTNIRESKRCKFVGRVSVWDLTLYITFCHLNGRTDFFRSL